MMTTVIPFTSPLSPDQVEQIKRGWEQGKVLAVPTDSFYALAVNPFHSEAIIRLLQIKGERFGKPIPVLIGKLEHLDHLVTNVPEIGQTLIREFWPGLLTMVFSAQRNLPESLTGGSGTVGVRQPSDQRLCELLRQIGPLTGTSANPSGQPPASTPEEVQGYFGDDIHLLLHGGSTPGGAPSTVLQVSEEIRVFREGAIPTEIIQKVVRNQRNNDKG